MDPNSPRLYVLVTGANSGLGLSICLRLLDEHISKATSPTKSSTPYPSNLTLLLTTRTSAKSNATIRTLQSHLSKYTKEEQALVTLQPESVNLISLLSVQRLARKLNNEIPYLNAVVCNAGIGGWIGIDWPLAIWTVLTDLVQSVTFPRFKLSGTGFLTAPQLPASSEANPDEKRQIQKDITEPPLGEIFTANLFGHYMLSHWLMPLLNAPQIPPSHSGRIILVSSIEASHSHFNPSDPQGLLSPASYESSKRMTDILALTSRLPSTQPWVSLFLTAPSPSSQTTHPTTTPTDPPNSESGSRPKIYLTHPGVCATAIVSLPYILHLAMIAAMYLARLFGSPWHPTSSYLGATAPVWLALSSQSVLDDFETPPQPEPNPDDSKYSQAQNGSVKTATATRDTGVTRPIKWGSCTDWRGNEGVMPTEVEGWGLMGLESDGVEGRRGRKRGATAPSTENREEFEQVGREVWRYLEELRGEWEGRLKEFD